MRIIVFQRGELGKHIIEGLKKHSEMDIDSFTVSEELPALIDNPEEFIDSNFEADLIFDHLHHRDLSEYLVDVAKNKGVPIIIPGAKIKGAINPAICCALVTGDKILGFEKFGYPEFKLEVKDGKITNVEVLRGAPCGATWDAAEKLKGIDIADAPKKIALETQFLCKAATGYDVAKSKKAPVHLAGDVHKKAMKQARKSI